MAPQIVVFCAMEALLPWNVDAEVRAMVRSGAVAYELCRPVDLYNLWFMKAMAWRTAPTILRAAPMTILAMFVLPLIGLDEWRLQAPAFANGAAFVAAVACTLLLSCALTTLLNITLLWTVSGEGAAVMLTALTTLSSGMVPCGPPACWFWPFSAASACSPGW
jgi:ABC-2 type transport system permease protein